MHATLVSNGTHRIQWAVGLAVDTTAHHGSSIRHHHTTYLGARTVDTVTWNCKLFSAPGRVKHFLVPSLQVHRNLRRNTKGRPCFMAPRPRAGHAHGHGASRLARSVRSRLCRVRRAGHETLGCAGAALQGKLPFLKKSGMAAKLRSEPMSVVRTKPITDIGWSAPTLAYGAPARTPRTAQGPRATPTATRTRRHESSHYLRQSTRYTCVHADDRCRYMLYMLTRAGLYSTRLLPRCHLID